MSDPVEPREPDELIEEIVRRAVTEYIAQTKNDPDLPPPVYLAPDRYVTVAIYAAISGRSENSIRMKMKNGVWLDRRDYSKGPDGRIFIDREAIQRWMLRGS